MSCLVFEVYILETCMLMVLFYLDLFNELLHFNFSPTWSRNGRAEISKVEPGDVTVLLLSKDKKKEMWL